MWVPDDRGATPDTHSYISWFVFVPAMAKMAAQMLKAMPAEQLAAIAEQNGMPAGMKARAGWALRGSQDALRLRLKGGAG